MNNSHRSQFGDFTVFGFTKNPQFLEHQLPDRLGIAPRAVGLGTAGSSFLYTAYGDVAETPESVALRLGFLRAPDRSSLSVQQLLDQGLITPRSVDTGAFTGNGLVACFSKTEPRFLVFKTLLCGIPLYYTVGKDGVLCSERLRCLVDVLDHLELDEAVIPQHFLLLSSIGSQSYYRGVRILRPGECLEWDGTGVQVRLIKDLRSLQTDPTYGRIDPHSPLIHQWFKEVIGAYVRDVRECGADFGNLLSGGVDSSFTQMMINEIVADKIEPAQIGVSVQPRSFSFRVQVPSFEDEVEYSKLAQAAFNTKHVFADVLPQDYPDLMVRSTEVLGQPVYMAMEPCKLALAEALASDSNSPRFFFNSQGADSVFGLSTADKLAKLDLARRIPASALVLGGAGKLLSPLTGQAKALLKAALILREPNHPTAPINTVVTSGNFDFALRCFGEEAVQKVFELRRGLETEYLDSPNYSEKVHFAVCLWALGFVVSQGSTLFLTHGKQMIYPYMDEDVIRIGLAVRPGRRYVRGRRVKYILKDLLEQRSSSPAPRLPKRGSSFNPDVCAWMDSGPLRDMVRSIDRPGFLSQPEFERLLERPDHYSLWALLTLDIFSKRFLHR
jgi:asparagine synthetase B (glutamine-hydrolysing)